MPERRGLGKADIQPILDELKAGLEAIYGPRLRQVILFGSYARGEAEEGSDVDVAVVLDEYGRSAEEAKRIEEVWGALCLDNDVLIQPLFVRLRDVQAPWQPVHLSIRREGVPV